MITLKNLQTRLETIFELYTEEEIQKVFKKIEQAFDAIIRLEGADINYKYEDGILYITPGYEHQFNYFLDFLKEEKERTNGFTGLHTLANDKVGYAGIYILSILNHHCQKCAEDKNAWHTRGAFCKHK